MVAVLQPRQLARFALLRELGRGAQATVWLAHDPRLQREVALKLLHTGTDAQAVSGWLQEARAVSRLKHPNIVPVFEADEHGGQPYLVFEYVEGPTLAQSLRKQPLRPARESVSVMFGVLDALEAAHEQGIVHRDLKPSNILLSADGRARVMDFGIAAGMAPGQDPLAGRIVGTPGYISPEAARGAAAVPVMDVFAAGAMLAEMLGGAPVLLETDPLRAVHRVQHEDLALSASAAVDGSLRGIVNRALARDPLLRYDSARAFRDALALWLNPAATVTPVESGGHATLEFLLRRMRHRTDFPALSNAVVRIQRVAASDNESARVLTDEILKDVALTHKLLRMVNTAHFSAVASGGVDTVSRAVALVGFAGIRNMALSLVLLEHMPDKAQAALLKGEFLRALMAGMVASELAPRAGAGEDAFLGALLQNLGRLLTEYYLPEEAQQIRQQLQGDRKAPPWAENREAREAAALRVLGISFDELGAGVVRAWGLPETLQRAMRTPQGEPPTRAVDRAERGVDAEVERLRWLGRGANAWVDALQSGKAEARALADVVAQHAPMLGLTPGEVLAATQAARTRLAETAMALGLALPAGSAGRRLLDATPAAAGADAPTWVAPLPVQVPNATSPPLLMPPAQAQAVLTQALESARAAVAGKTMNVSELLHLVLDTLHRALQFRNVVFCLREPSTGCLVGRIGLGPGGAEVSAAFRFTPDGAAVGDLFAVICAKGADLMVADATTVAIRIPPWYRKRVNAPTFLLLPVMVKGAPMGLIYADKAHAGTIALGEAELTLLRALRNQVCLAFSR